MIRSTTAAATLVLGFICIPSALGGTGATFYGLGQINGSSSTEAFRISADGTTVVGVATISSVSQPFRWTLGTGMQLLPLLPGASQGQALGVSGDGSIIVGSNGTTTGRAVRWHASGVIEDLGNAPGTISQAARTVSRDGLAIAVDGAVGRPSRWTQSGGYQSINMLPGGTLAFTRQISLDGNVIVGEGNSTGQTSNSFRWTPATGSIPLGTLPGHTGSVARGVDADGSVVVGFSQGSAGQQAYRWTEALGMVGLGTAPNDFTSQAFACSGDGSVIVGIGARGSPTHPIIWREDIGMMRLDELLGDAIPAGWELRTAQSISEDGFTITGWGVHNGRTESWVAIIPSPGSVSLLVVGVVACARRRR